MRDINFTPNSTEKQFDIESITNSSDAKYRLAKASWAALKSRGLKQVTDWPQAYNIIRGQLLHSTELNDFIGVDLLGTGENKITILATKDMIQEIKNCKRMFGDGTWQPIKYHSCYQLYTFASSIRNVSLKF